jgi:hypothetical protein
MLRVPCHSEPGKREDVWDICIFTTTVLRLQLIPYPHLKGFGQGHAACGAAGGAEHAVRRWERLLLCARAWNRHSWGRTSGRARRMQDSPGPASRHGHGVAPGRVDSGGKVSGDVPAAVVRRTAAARPDQKTRFRPHSPALGTSRDHAPLGGAEHVVRCVPGLEDPSVIGIRTFSDERQRAALRRQHACSAHVSSRALFRVRHPGRPRVYAAGQRAHPRKSACRLRLRLRAAAWAAGSPRAESSGTRHGRPTQCWGLTQPHSDKRHMYVSHPPRCRNVGREALRRRWATTSCCDLSTPSSVRPSSPSSSCTQVARPKSPMDICLVANVCVRERAIACACVRASARASARMCAGALGLERASE